MARAPAPQRSPSLGSARIKSVNRRAPRQARSQITVDAILSATKALVRRHGVERLTTNGVARLAGVSIGSLYQYFPSKRALVDELRKQHQQEGWGLLLRGVAHVMTQPLEVSVRYFVEQMIAVHRVDPELHRALESNRDSTHATDVELRALALVRADLERRKHEVTVENLDQAAFVLGVTVEALTHRAAAERPELLEDPTLVDGVTRMLLAYLTGKPSAP